MNKTTQLKEVVNLLIIENNWLKERLESRVYGYINFGNI